MSWDAHFGSYWVNYTHNTNGMIAVAYEDATGNKTPQAEGILGPVIGPAWWKKLSGMTGRQGAEYLSYIINALEENPDKYKAMNPDNGWGSYDGLLRVLNEMQKMSDADREGRTTWYVSG